MGEKRTVTIRLQGLALEAEIDNNETGDKILSILPITSRANRWGDEVYFSIPLSVPRAPDARGPLMTFKIVEIRAERL